MGLRAILEYLGLREPEEEPPFDFREFIPKRSPPGKPHQSTAKLNDRPNRRIDGRPRRR